MPFQDGIGPKPIEPEPVETVLRRRGFRIASRGQTSRLLVPRVMDPLQSGEDGRAWRRLLAKSAFRKIILRLSLGAVSLNDLEMKAPQRASEYVAFLAQHRVATVTDGIVSLAGKCDYGRTLEWVVADTLNRDFSASTDWSVALDGAHYNDYDVLAWLPPIMVYVETKGKPAKSISDSELKEFLQRGEQLSPEIAILMIDTEDDLSGTDIIGRLFEIMIRPVRLSSGIKDG